jgi:regulator of protease activity HflC (stomatin/prohibitin superfamily)
MKIDIDTRDRAILMVNGKPAKYLAPGRHLVFRPFSKVEVVRIAGDKLFCELTAEQLALVPAEAVQVLAVGQTERAVVSKRGKVVAVLGAGVHQLVTFERADPRGEQAGRPAVTVERLDVSGVAVKPLRDEVKAQFPQGEYVETTAPAGSVALRYVDGALDAVLPAGRHAAFSVAQKVTFAVIDLRERLLAVQGQDVMTRDRVTLRLNVSAAFRVADVERLATVARAPDELVYLALQLAAREAVGARTLDELLASRESLGVELAGQVKERALKVGLELVELGVKDLVLPGEMKALLNRVIEAQKAAEANVITRREEVAAVRSMAQTAKVLAENPLLMRLKELEAYQGLAEKVGQVHLVLGEGGLPALQLGSGKS